MTSDPPVRSLPRHSTRPPPPVVTALHNLHGLRRAVLCMHVSPMSTSCEGSMRAALRMPAHRRAARSLEAACSCQERLRLSLVRAITETRKEAKEAGARSACSFWLSYKWIRFSAFQNQAGSSAVSAVSQPTGTARARRGLDRPVTRSVRHLGASLSGRLSLSVWAARSQSVCGRAQTKILT